MNPLEGKVALITGANRGIGRGVATCLAEDGADVLVNYRTHQQEAQEVVEAIIGMRRRALAWQADVGDRAQVEDMVKSAVNHFGKLDIAVANAAYSVRQAVVEAKWEDVQRVVNVSQFGVFHTCQFAARQMVEQGGGGKIIVISSIHAELPVARSAAYNMAKAAVNHLVATMANELARHHINVNAINPGWIDTPGERQFATEEEIRRGALRIPWGRLGTPRDIGRTVAFLASEHADYITGSCIRVDGGFMPGLTLPDGAP
jgi:glucose 1-dehydrogenase